MKNKAIINADKAIQNIDQELISIINTPSQNEEQNNKLKVKFFEKKYYLF